MNEAYKTQQERAATLDGWNLVDNSSDQYAVYQDPTTGRVRLNFRGTKNDTDIFGPDLSIALGIEEGDDRFRDSLGVYDTLAEKYGKDKVSLSGHSLGGTLARYIAKERQAPATTFNAAYGPYKDPGLADTSDDYVTNMDPFSTHMQKVTRLDPKSANTHGLENFYI